jgi:transcriptional regulator with XRE-family HTH domain
MSRQLKNSLSEKDELSGLHQGIGPFFKSRRLHIGLSQADVARYLGHISTVTLELYEKGRKRVPLQDVYALANCLNVAPDLVISAMNQSRRPRARG